ncbi:hypothetical protein AMS68_002943 [Peltaster fructicola]|uniref:ATP-dependent RNA helicase ROK1 n=1 Tax=Peltaster fructicola TaxID=286661 RepID=A0A6H0XRV8_9PEZI|nr:hypothetical protein AMS68_002943 [Peltaster fructicola]
MDTLRLLSRGTKTKSAQKTARQTTIPSSQPSRPQLFSERPAKRQKTSPALDENEDFFHKSEKTHRPTVQHEGTLQDGVTSSSYPARSLAERKALLKQHKIKIALISPVKKSKRSQRAHTATKTPLYPDPLLNFDQLQGRSGIPTWLVRNIQDQNYHEATEVQMAAIPLLSSFKDSLDDSLPQDCNLLAVAPTGSGKTLAFLVPTLTGINNIRRQSEDKSRSIKALILVPTKELVGQIVNEGKVLTQSAGIKISAYTKDMRLTDDALALSDELADSDTRTVARSDILVSTPGHLHAALAGNELSQVRYLILDEADVLLDPLFREQTLGIWKSLTNPQLQVSLWSATMGSNIEDLVGSTGPFMRLVVGLKDSAVPNVQHKLIYAATEQGKLMGLRQLLRPVDSGLVLRPPFLVFTQTIERAIALHAELLYDIPAQAGVNRIAVLHSNLSDTARDDVMSRFRRGDIWVLITTDLLSRGIDFRGVNGVVNYDIPSSSAAYIHRAGRTGRAGREGGVAVTLYSKEDIPYLKHIANVIAVAQKQAGEDIQQWLLDALPTLSKNDKQKFKKYGVESRTAKGMLKDPKAARKARISTKAGYLKRVENKRKGAIRASQQRAAEIDQDVDMDFAGFG